MTDELRERLERIIVGGLPSEPVAITLAEYDPAWPAWFEEHRRRLTEALGPLALSIEHIGSTSVPDLAAKPIVDVLVVVDDPDDEASFGPKLLGAGYEVRVREPGHRMFRPPSRDANEHVWARGSDEIDRYIAFRDRLRSCAADRDLYETAKRELVKRKWPTVDHYAEAKSAVIAQILQNARGR